MRTKTDVHVVSLSAMNLVGFQPRSARARKWFDNHHVPPGASAMWSGGWLWVAGLPAVEAVVTELVEAGFFR